MTTRLLHAPLLLSLLLLCATVRECLAQTTVGGGGGTRRPAVRLFEQTAQQVWSKIAHPPGQGPAAIEGLFQPLFDGVSPSGGGKMLLRINHSIAAPEYAAIYTTVPAVPLLDTTAPARCTARELTVTFEYTIPDNFVDECANVSLGYEAFLLLSESGARPLEPRGLGAATTGGAHPKYKTTPEPLYTSFSPTTRAMIFAIPEVCTIEVATCHIVQRKDLTWSGPGDYATTFVMTVDSATEKFRITSLRASFNGAQRFDLAPAEIIHPPLLARWWLGRAHAAGSESLRPLLYLVAKCVDVVVNRLTIDAVDICAPGTTVKATTAPLSTTSTTTTTTTQRAVTTPPRTLPATVVTQSALPSAVVTTVATTSTTTTTADLATAQTAPTADVSTASSAATTTTTAAGTEGMPTASTSSTTTVSSQAATTGNDTDVDTGVAPVSVAPSFERSSETSNAPMFIGLACALFCVFCVLLMCTFRKRLRRNELVQRAYLATPGRRWLWFFCGSKMEDEVSRGEELLNDSSI